MKFSGDRLVALRLRMGMSQEELSKQSLVAVRTIRRLEHGKHTPQPANWKALADALEVEVADLAEADPDRVGRTSALAGQPPAANSRGLHPSEGIGTGSASRQHDPALVERDAQLEAMLSIATSAQERAVPGLCVIQGAAGSGKTALLRAAIRRLESDALVLQGAGPQFNSSRFPFRPFRDAIAPRLAALATSLDEASAEILGRFAKGEEDGPTDDGTFRYRTFQIVADGLLGASRDRLVVLAIDDLQWCDLGSLDLLEHIVQQAVACESGTCRLVVLVALREESEFAPGRSEAASETSRHAKALLERLRRADLGVSLRLVDLTESGTHELLARRGVRSAQPSLVSEVHEITRGNPLFICAAARMLLEQPGRGRDPRPTESLHLDIPADVADAIALRLAGISEPCRQLLQLSSLLGVDFDLPRLEAVSHETEQSVQKSLQEAAEAGLIEETGPSRYAFDHPIVRQVLYDGLTRVVRQQLHASIVERLRTTKALEIEIAQQLVGAGPYAPADAVEILCGGARQAVATSCWRESARLYKAAVEIGDSRGELSDQRSAELNFWAAHTHYKAHDFEDAEQFFRVACGAASRCNDTIMLARVINGRSRLRDSSGRGTTRDVEALQSALEELPSGNTKLRAQLLDTLATCHNSAGQSELADGAANEAASLADELGDERLRSQASSSLAISLMMRLRVEDGLKEWRLGLTLARAAGDLELQAQRLQRIPLALFALGRLHEVADVADEALAISARVHSLGEPALVLATQASAFVIRGDLASAEEFAREALDRSQRSGYTGALAMSYLALAATLSQRARIDEALQALDALRTASNSLAPWAQRLAKEFSLGVSMQAGGRIDPLEIPAPWGPPEGHEYSWIHLATLCLRVELGARLEKPALIAPARAALALAESRKVEFSAGWPFGILRMLGDAALAEERKLQAKEYYSRALELYTQIGAPLEAAHTLLGLAQLEDKQTEPNKHRAPSRLLDQAVAISVKHGFLALLDRCRAIHDRGY